MSKKCPFEFCGKDNPDEAKYCMYCGVPLSKVDGKSYYSLERDNEDHLLHISTLYLTLYVVVYSLALTFTHRNQAIWWAYLEAIIFSFVFGMATIFAFELFKLVAEKVKTKSWQVVSYILIFLTYSLFVYILR